VLSCVTAGAACPITAFITPGATCTAGTCQ
jgi:hypothetical protein